MRHPATILHVLVFMAAVLLAVVAPPFAAEARADAFVAAGVVAPGPRGLVAVSVGKCCRQRAGFEVEYAAIGGGRESSTGTVSVNAQVMLGGLSPRSRLYVTAGVGVWTDWRPTAHACGVSRLRVG